MDQVQNNVLGGPLKSCNHDPKTGFFRDGCCHTGPQDRGRHVICALMSEQFLQFSKAQGNDLSTPRPQWQFPGLKAGDKWCLCATRWRDAMEVGMAPMVDLEATHESALEIVSIETLLAHAALDHQH